MNNYCFHEHQKFEKVKVHNIGIHDYYDMVSEYTRCYCKDCNKTLRYTYTGKSWYELNDFGQQMAGKTNKSMFPAWKDASDSPLERRDFLNHDARKKHHHHHAPVFKKQ